jgi:hypothetical protein
VEIRPSMHYYLPGVSHCRRTCALDVLNRSISNAVMPFSTWQPYTSWRSSSTVLLRVVGQSWFWRRMVGSERFYLSCRPSTTIPDVPGLFACARRAASRAASTQSGAEAGTVDAMEGHRVKRSKFTTTIQTICFVTVNQ